MGALIAALRFMEYDMLVRDHAIELYGGMIALIFTALGIWLGLKLTSKKPESHAGAPVHIDDKLKELGISRREYEILTLIAEGRSTREISEELFVSSNTVKTHASRLYVKLDARRRTQAVQNARMLGILK